MAGEQNTVRVGAAAIIENEEGKILLAKRNVFPKGIWVLPGGGVDYGETSEKAVVREIKEETGLTIKPTQLIKVHEMIIPENNIHRIIFFYRAKMISGNPSPSSDIEELKWIYPKEVPGLDNLGNTVTSILKEAGLLS